MCVDLSLGFLFCSIDLYFCLCTITAGFVGLVARMELSELSPRPVLLTALVPAAPGKASAVLSRLVPGSPAADWLGIIRSPLVVFLHLQSHDQNTVTTRTSSVYTSPDAHCSRVQSGLGQLGLF